MSWKQSKAWHACRSSIAALLISALGAVSCAAPEAGARITWDEFVGKVSPATGRQGYIVDRDIYLADLDALRTYYDTYVAQEVAGKATGSYGHYRSEPNTERATRESMIEQGLTVDQVNGIDDIWGTPARFNLTYCISNSFGSDLTKPKNKQAVINALDIASRSWDAIVNVKFAYVSAQDASCTGSNTNVSFNVASVSDSSFFANSFFPRNARSDRQLQIDDSAFTTTEGGRDLQGILRHELGHTLGFRHEHIWLGPRCSESTADARQVTPYDVNSVMHYPQCRPSGGGGYRQSQFDYGGSTALYGLTPALIMTSQLALR
jgi:hypothetical protein